VAILADREEVAVLKLVSRWIVVAIALIVAVMIVPGIRVEGNAWIAFGVTAAILGLINAFVRPILAFLACGCIVATLGFFILVINAFTLWLASWIAQNWFSVGFVVDGFWAALWGALIVSIVSFILSMFVYDE
jgi:putative membrane protein